MKIHQMNLEGSYFESMKLGDKIYEVRVFDKKRQQVSLKDQIEFKHEDSKITVSVEKMLLFDNFKEALLCVGIENALPGCKSLDEATKIYESIMTSNGSYKELAKEQGVVAMRIKLVD